MYQHLANRRKSWFERISLPTALAFVSVVYLTCLAAPTARLEPRRAGRGLTISLHRSSPPYAALEDDLADGEDAFGKPDAKADLQSPPIGLVAGLFSLEPVARRIRLAAIASEQASRVALFHRRIDSVFSSVSARFAFSSPVSGSILPVRDSSAIAPRLARVQERALPAFAASGGPPASFGAEELDPPAAMTVSYRPSGRIVLSRKNALASLFAPIVAAGGPRFARQFASAQTASAPRVPQAPHFAALQMSPLPIAHDLAVARVNSGSNRSAASLEATVSGAVEMVGGLALSSHSDRLAVYRELNGKRLEAGNVSIKNGRYEILVSAREGQLVGELRGAQGDALGRGAIDLADISQKERQFRFEQMDLKLAPISSQLVARVSEGGFASASGTATFANPALDSAKVDLDSTEVSLRSNKKGMVAAASALEGSTAIARAAKAGFWSALAYLAPGAANQLSLFSEKSIASFLAVVGQDPAVAKRRENAIVWGRVLQNGAPLSAARVELASGSESTRAIYFDSEFKPDPVLQATSSSGLYAFYPVLSGVQLAQASPPDGSRSETLAFAAEDGATSNIDIEMTSDRAVETRVYDAFKTGLGLSARVAAFGRELVSETDESGRGEAKFSSSQAIHFVDVDAGREYAATRIALAQNRSLLLAPMVRLGWLDQLSGALRINQVPKSGTVVGFVQGAQPYQVQMNVQSSIKIVYFDDTGHPTGESFGRPGGGFVLFNAPEGLQTLALQPQGSARIAYAVLLIERNVVNVAMFSPR